MKKYKKNGILFIILPIALILKISCNFIAIDPPVTQPSGATVYSNNGSAIAVLTGIYIRMSAGGFSSGSQSISLLSGLSSDELRNYALGGIFPAFYKNALRNDAASSLWKELYEYIYMANAAMEGIAASQTVSVSIKEQLIGEAKFIRAYCNFYLVNLFGDIPLVTSTDYRLNSIKSRTPQFQIYQQIISDLLDAQKLLKTYFVSADGESITDERVRPNSWAATALLARTYLYIGDWTNAESQASAVINNTSTYSLNEDLNNVFLKNSTEAIWQLQPTVPTWNTFDGPLFILTSGPNEFQNPVSISIQLYDSFEANDKRKAIWIGENNVNGQTYYFPYKYKVGIGAPSVTEYMMMMRLSEQYLIRAEARAQQGNLAGAQADLNLIRNRAGLPNTTAQTTNSLLSAVEHERQTELFTEWGHRWLDLKRTKKVEVVMSTITPQKGGLWKTDWQLYPIPLSEILINSNLTQNKGY